MVIQSDWHVIVYYNYGAKVLFQELLKNSVTHFNHNSLLQLKLTCIVEKILYERKIFCLRFFHKQEVEIVLF